MKLSKIDLSNIVAIGHNNGNLGVVIDRGESMEYIEINAPEAAYHGLQQLDYIVNNEIDCIEEITDGEIPMLPINSSIAEAIGYDEEEQILQIEFNNGSVYQYYDVESETWEYFQKSPSKGLFYNSEIKGYYESDRVE